MTNRDYIGAELAPLGLTPEAIDALFVGASILPKEEAIPRQCDRLLYNKIGTLILGASRNISEGNLSISYNLDALRLYYRALCTKLGKPNVLDAPAPRAKMRYRSM